MGLPNSEAAEATTTGRRVVLLREAWVGKVADFIASAGTEEEAELEGRPEIVFSQGDPIGLASHYADFNVRSRHFRVIESFFVEVDEQDRICGVLAVDGLRRGRRLLKVQLLVARKLAGESFAEHLQRLLAGAYEEASRFVPAMVKLRFIYVFDPSLCGPLGAYVSKTLVEDAESVGITEEARIANETGPGREAVLLGFFGSQQPSVEASPVS